MTPQQPFKGNFKKTQGYWDNANNYPGGKHAGLDLIPFISSGIPGEGTPYPAPIYPILPGKTIGINDSDNIRGRGIKVRSELNSGFIRYLKDKGLVPIDYNNKVFLEHLYWHCLEVTDKDGLVDKETSIAVCGNTGWVTSNGQLVPEDQRGIPPYPGLHLHLECILKGENQTFNLNQDFQGRIDPEVILAYEKEKSMKLIKNNGTVYLVAGKDDLKVTGISDEQTLMAFFGDEPIDEGELPTDQTLTLTTGFIAHKR